MNCSDIFRSRVILVTHIRVGFCFLYNASDYSLLLFLISFCLIRVEESNSEMAVAKVQDSYAEFYPSNGVNL
jgi:hypothetical protein